jgi:hypothetical protein
LPPPLESGGDPLERVALAPESICTALSTDPRCIERYDDQLSGWQPASNVIVGTIPLLSNSDVADRNL